MASDTVVWQHCFLIKFRDLNPLFAELRRYSGEYSTFVAKQIFKESEPGYIRVIVNEYKTLSANIFGQNQLVQFVSSL